MFTRTVFSVFFIFIMLLSSVSAQQSVAARNRYKVAKNMFTQGRYEDAEKELTESLKLDGRYSDALFLMGLTKWQLKQHDEAIKYFEQVIRQEPKYYTARLYLATVCLENGNVSRAEDQVKFYMQNQPSEPDGYYAMGVIHYKNGDLPKAIELWEKALSVDNNHASSWCNKGLALYLLGKKDEALASIEKALSIKTANTNLYRFLRGCINYDTGNKDEAFKDLKYLAELIPATTIGLTSSAIMLAEEQKWDEALEKANSALKIEPLFQKALEIKAVCLEHKEDLDGAINCLDTILKHDANQKQIATKKDNLKVKPSDTENNAVNDTVNDTKNNIENNTENNEKGR
jgi:Tfp pilus assembly protein PilF